MKTSANAASLLLTGSARNALLFLIAFGLFSGAPLLPGVETETARTSGETKSRAKLPVPNVSHTEQKPSASRSGEKKGEESEALVHLTEAQRNLIRLRLSRATPGRIDNTIRLNGEIRLNRNETAKVMPRMPGFVSGIHVREGDIVRKGDRLATLTSHKLGEYYAAYNSALEQEKLAKSEFEMAEKLKGGQATSRKEYLRYKREYAESVISRRHAEELLRSLLLDPAHPGHPHGKSPGEILPICTTYDVTAPLNGTVIARNVTLGENFTEDTLPVLFTISNLERLWLDLRASPQELLRIRKGQEVTVTVAGINQEFRGKVVYLAPVIDEQTRTGLVRIEVDNRSFSLRPGQFAVGTIQTDPFGGTVVVPREAVQLIAGETVVFVPQGDGFVPRPVVPGRSSGGSMQILSGLHAGEEFVSSGAFELKSILLTSGMDPHAGHGH